MLRHFSRAGLALACLASLWTSGAFGEPKAAPPAGKPLSLGVAKKPAPVPEPVSPEVALQKANAYLNAATMMTADFVQVSVDGKRAEGKLYIHRPGRMRFEYAQPATLEIVSDGGSVMVRDRKLGTQDLYFISQTPLKFLLQDHIDLAKDVKVIDVAPDERGVVISVEDKQTFGGTSLIKLIFDPKTYALKQWQVTDPQGYETLVTLFNIDLKQTPDPTLFQINSGRFTNPN